jgi:hypothetical protein
MSDPQTNPSLTHTAFLWLCLGALLCCQQAKGQTTFNVPSDFATIQQALDASASGDTILVSPGKYPQNLNFDGKEVTLRSTDGPESTHINVNGGTAVTIANQAEISGFTISGARNTFGAGMSVSGVGTIIRGNIFDGNVQSAGGFGAAIAGNTASPVIDSNIFRNNTSDFQFTSGVVAFVNSSAPQIVNNIFHDNNSRAINLTLPTGNNPHVINNTFVDK